MQRGFGRTVSVGFHSAQVSDLFEPRPAAPLNKQRPPNCTGSWDLGYFAKETLSSPATHPVAASVRWSRLDYPVPALATDFKFSNPPRRADSLSFS
ncbi:hypothetical protein VTK56DRAFT_9456 [Thermocarpiscus australiensis]